MITIKLVNNPGYPTRNPDYLGTIHHTVHGVAASVNTDYGSTTLVRRYLCGLEKPNHPVPALLQDSQSDLAKRWSNWLDDDRLAGRKY